MIGPFLVGFATAFVATFALAIVVLYLFPGLGDWR